MSRRSDMHASDYNLLCGVLALEHGFVSRDELIDAMQVWLSARKTRDVPLAQVLEQCQCLAPEQRERLETLVAQDIETHSPSADRTSTHAPSTDAGTPSPRDEQPQADTWSIAAPAPENFDPLDTKPAVAGERRPASNSSMQDDPTLQKTPRDPGQQLGPDNFDTGGDGRRFRVLRPHARGGLGEVFIALDRQLNREVALKQIQPQHADVRESRTRFVLEAEVTGGLEHPGIVPIYALGHDGNGRPFYAMRFIRGESLHAASAEFHASANRSRSSRNLELRKLLHRFIDVCNAVEYAHSRGVLHRDLKPGNVMLGKYGETLVVDWGLAKTLRTMPPTAESHDRFVCAADDSAPATADGTLVGTPGFMSPEQAAGQIDQLGPSSDVYSLGATLYFLLTGKSPLHGETDMGRLLKRIAEGDFPAPRDVEQQAPRPLDAICRKAMRVRAADRYASAAAIAEDVEHWLADEPVTAHRETLAERFARWSRRHRSLIRAASVALVVVCCVLIVATLAVHGAWRDEALHRQEALRRLRQTRGVIDELLVGVSDDLGQVAGAGRVRERLLQRAASEYEVLTRELSDDVSLRHEAAWALLRLGSIESALGNTDRMQHHYERAHSEFTSLSRRPDALPEYRSGLATSLEQLGRFHSIGGKLEQGERLLRQSLAHYEMLRAADSKNPQIQYGLAVAERSLGDCLEQYGRLDEAGDHLRRSADLFEPLINVKLPGVQAADLQFQTSLRHLTIIARRRGKIDDADAAYQRIIAHAARLEQQSPTDFAVLAEVAEYRIGYGDFLLSVGRYAEADERLQTAQELLERVVRSNPDLPHYRFRLAKLRQSQTNSFRNQGQHRQAMETLEQADAHYSVLVLQMPNQAEYLHGQLQVLADLAMICIDFGRIADAERFASRGLAHGRKLVQDHPEVVMYRNNLARVSNQLGRALRRLNRLDETESIWNEAIVQYEHLVEQNPDRPNLRHELALQLNNMGSLMIQMQKLDEAEQVLRRANEQATRLVADQPQPPDYKELLLMVRMHLGSVLQGLDKADEARDLMRDSITVGEQLVTDVPANPNYAFRLAQLELQTAGSMANDLMQIESEGVTLMESANSRLTELHERHPNVAEFRSVLWAGLQQLAAAKTTAEDWAHAIEIWNKVDAMEAEGVSAFAALPPAFRVFQSFALASSGEPQRALQRLETCITAEESDAVYLYYAVRTCFRCGHHTLMDAALTNELREESFGRIAGVGIGLFRRAHAAGAFDLHGAWSSLIADPATEPFFARDEFAQQRVAIEAMRESQE